LDQLILTKIKFIFQLLTSKNILILNILQFKIYRKTKKVKGDWKMKQTQKLEIHLCNLQLKINKIFINLYKI
jgi:hypothetical protein